MAVPAEIINPDSLGKSRLRSTIEYSAIGIGIPLFLAGGGSAVYDLTFSHPHIADEKFPSTIDENEERFLDSGVIYYDRDADFRARVVYIDVEALNKLENSERAEAQRVADEESVRLVAKRIYQDTLSDQPMRIGDVELPISRFRFQLGTAVLGGALTLTSQILNLISYRKREVIDLEK